MADGNGDADGGICKKSRLHSRSESRRDANAKRTKFSPTETETMLAVMVEAGCMLCPSSDEEAHLLKTYSEFNNLQRRLQHRFETDPSLLPKFLAGLSSFIEDPSNLRRILLHVSGCDGDGFSFTLSVARVFLLVPHLQTRFFEILLEKLPEYFDDDSISANQDVARLILKQFRWIDFLVDSKASTKKLLEILSICPLPLKKEIISFLPDIVGTENNIMVVSSLEQFLKEDSNLIAPVLDAFSNINLEDVLFEQAVTIAISSLRIVDAENLPVVLKFLLESAPTTNPTRMVEQIRENLDFYVIPACQTSGRKKLKSKMISNETEVLIFGAIRSGLQFHNLIGETFLKVISTLDDECDHKVFDILLLVMICSIGGPLQRKAERLLQKKVFNNYFNERLLQQFIEGRGESLQMYFQDLLSICETFLSHKDLALRKFGVHMYILLFKEFTSMYHRQEVLGSLITHTGSGVSSEIDSALDSLFLLAKQHPYDLLPISSYINGILDYLEGFNDEHLHKVYMIFSELSLMVWSNSNLSSSLLANELIMILRKQIANQDIKFKKMGIIGTVKLVSSVNDTKFVSMRESLQAQILDEIFSLLQAVIDTCKSVPSARSFLYDELAELLSSRELDSIVIDWISKHTGEFENTFLLDLESGQIQGEVGDCSGVRGKVWMNLDGEVSPICLNILLLVASSERCSQALTYLPSYFCLLAAAERATNKGSLESIDALLGCPFYLPEYELLSTDSWKTLHGKHKQILCLSLYHGINWIVELLNAFSTQIFDQADNLTQNAQEEIIIKLFKRLRNLVFLESLLNVFLRSYNFSLPQLHAVIDSSFAGEGCAREKLKMKKKKIRGKELDGETISRIPTSGKKENDSTSCSRHGMSRNGLKQPRITSFLFQSTKGSTQLSSHQTQESVFNTEKDSGIEVNEEGILTNNENEQFDVSIVPEYLLMQKSKFRPLAWPSLSILSLSQCHSASCCADPAAELPLHLYLIRDFNYKLNCLDCAFKQFSTTLSSTAKASSGLKAMTMVEFFRETQFLFPSIRRHLDCAVNLLNGNCGSYSQHWMTESIASGNPPTIAATASRSVTAECIFKEILHCVHKILSIQDLLDHTSILRALLEAFQSPVTSADLFPQSNMQHSISSMELSFCRTFAFFEELFGKMNSASFLSLYEIILTIRALLSCFEAYVDNVAERKKRQVNNSQMLSLLGKFRNKLSALALNLLQYSSESCSQATSWKLRGDVLQQLLQMYIKYNESPGECLQYIACELMPVVPVNKTRLQDVVPGFPSLSSNTLPIWYRVQHEEVLFMLNKVVHGIAALQKAKTAAYTDNVKKLIDGLYQCVNVLVALVNMTRVHDKVLMHSIAVRYGGKFVDTFLKGFEFLHVHYDGHKSSIIILVKELQKATRTIQTLCSEAKGFRRTMVTSKIPAVKRSMERYLFCVKALLHNAANGETFWMGNLKHKDLQGREVSSQLPLSDDDEGPLNSHNDDAETKNEDDDDDDHIDENKETEESNLI